MESSRQLHALVNVSIRKQLQVPVGRDQSRSSHYGEQRNIRFRQDSKLRFLSHILPLN
jgi:hypothetical protein